MEGLEDVKQEQIDELRKGFLQRMETEGYTDKFHQRDIKRIKEDDVYVARFLLHHDCDMKEASNMVWETCKWRQEVGANEITAKDVPSVMLNKGAIFSHNRDKEGKRLFIFRGKKHAKGSEKMDDLKKLLTYWLERLEREELHSPVTVVLDLSDTGLTNMDMNFIQLFINMLKFYYPNYINYILIYEMPWILNAAWKIIKGWLPAKAVQRTKFLNRSSMKDYISPDQQLSIWGGKDDYEFVFVPEAETPSQMSTPTATVSPLNSPLPNGNLDEGKRKVHFAEGGEQQGLQVECSTGSTGSNNTVSFMDSVDNKKASFIYLSPTEDLVFSRESPGGELSSSLQLQNIKNQCIAYKIKTTAPEKYRVRPSLGVLRPQGTVAVTVQIQPGYHSVSVVKDKFLVMLLPVDSENMSQNELNDLWKGASSAVISQRGEQHRLRCSLAASDAIDTLDFPKESFQNQIEGLKSMIQTLVANQDTLMRREVRKMRRDIILGVTAVIVLMFAVATGIACWYRKESRFTGSCNF